MKTNPLPTTRLFSIVAFLAFTFQACKAPLPEDVELAYHDLPEKVDFNFHIRPLLTDRCFKCHGPDDNTREANLRLDIEKEAFAKLKESEGYAIKKGSLAKSVAWDRIVSRDPDFLMPPPDSHLSLSPKEKALIAKWIRQGAEWKEHWAFIPPAKPKIPLVEGSDVRNPIDNFVLAKLKEEGLKPSPIANKERLIRRLSFDLRGLPPSIQEIDSFLTDSRPGAYEALVDRFLATDAHAERMALDWLDVARFGDTQGMHFDAERYNWPWRDWVIKAFKENLAYDEFLTWQMAGDLLPNPTSDQRLATAFHRNHPTSSEGGIPDEEFRQKYVQDRANTTATVFMGLTLECATCHDHKFDPISQKEYYQMTAFFNNLKEVGMVSEFRMSKSEPKGPMFASGPVMFLPETEPETELRALEQKIIQKREQIGLSEKEIAASKEFIESLPSMTAELPKADGVFPFESIQHAPIKDGVVHRIQGNSPINQIVDRNRMSLACGNPQLVEGMVGKALRSAKEMDMVFLKDIGNFEHYEAYSGGAWIFMEDEGKNQSVMGTSGALGNAWRGWELYLDTLNRLAIKMVSIAPHNYMQVIAEPPIQKEQWTHIFFTYDGSGTANGLQLYINGKKSPVFVEYDNLYGSIIHRWRKREEWQRRPMMVFRSGRYHAGENGVYTGAIDQIQLFRRKISPLEVAKIFEVESGKTNTPIEFTKQEYLAHYLDMKKGSHKQLRKELEDLLAQKLSLMEQVPEVQVMEDMPGFRKTFVLDRGQYDAPTEEVFPGTPTSVLSFPDHLPKNRLGLAQWFIDDKNPLTGRVAVNRYWQMIFGTGIVETPHDFGTQGALPSHPELLDWLAIDFMESGWDIRALIKKMVMSATYRQSSVATEAHRELDFKNKFLARAPSYRLQAEMIRDNALAASGLLNPKIGGPSVKPYQPEGVWDFGVLVSGVYEADKGEDLYRRSMYTYIRRTSPHPAMIAFDAPNRLVCVAKRENTNTPLQALVLLNDPQFVEAARVLAARMGSEGGISWEEKAEYGFRLLCGRKPNAKEMGLMKQQYLYAKELYESNPDQARDLLQVGEYPINPELDIVETAALSMLASTMMNFDEAYMKR